VGIIPGIKVDAGAKDLAGHPGEKITEDWTACATAQGVCGNGARFAKWRAVITIGGEFPARLPGANAQSLARYAALCQEAGVVPIVEPEVLMDGDHTLQRCKTVTRSSATCSRRTLDLHRQPRRRFPRQRRQELPPAQHEMGLRRRLYLSDWHDQNPCHQTKPDDWDYEHGRIYRIQLKERRRRRRRIWVHWR